MTDNCGKDIDSAAFVGNHKQGGHFSRVWDSVASSHDYHSRLAECLIEGNLCTDVQLTPTVSSSTHSQSDHQVLFLCVPMCNVPTDASPLVLCKSWSRVHCDRKCFLYGSPSK